MWKDNPRADAGLVAGVEPAGVGPEPARPAREFLSIKEALASYGFSRSFLYELMGRGLVRSAKVGRRRLVHAPTLRAFVCSRMDGADGRGGVPAAAADAPRRPPNLPAAAPRGRRRP
jgi:hypothetical protein